MLYSRPLRQQVFRVADLRTYDEAQVPHLIGSFRRFFQKTFFSAYRGEGPNIIPLYPMEHYRLVLVRQVSRRIASLLAVFATDA